MRIVMIGGAGHVGRLIRPVLAEFADVTVADRAGASAVDGATSVEVDVRDPDGLREVLRGADVLVFLAMGSKAEWGSLVWAQSQFEVNVLGLHTALEIAAECGVTQCVVAGSMSIFEDFLHVSGGDAPDANDAYGLSKRLGRRSRVRRWLGTGLDVTVLRLVLPMDDETWAAEADDKHADVMTSGTDTAAAFVAAIRRRPAGFTAFAISGDITSRLVDVSEARARLGWMPTAVRQPAAG